MNSPSMVHRSGDTLVVRSVVDGNELFTDEPEDESEDIDYSDEFFDDNKNLPECKIRRNYSCVNCHFFTQNPRHYLYHLRDVHKEKVKIYECSNCLYASKHLQKLLRHTKMVHSNLENDVTDPAQKQKVRRKRKRPSTEQPPEDLETYEDDVHQYITDDSPSKSSDLKCSLCSFSTKHQGQLTKHEKQEHIKTKFFRCSKCNYVTHIKARFTKHVKYHSMPMIKCDLCDFRTPYKWNLDRHYKNHNGHGAFRCSACNFTADIKQSLTVHEMNHHVPPVGQAAGLGVGRRRNKVGASDTTAAEEAAAIAAAQAASQPAEDITPTPPALQQNNQVPTPEKQENIEQIKKSPKIKKQKNNNTQEQNERHNFETDFIHPDDIIHHSNEMARHEQKFHNTREGQQIVKKTPRPIPNLIPIQNSQAASLKIPQVQNKLYQDKSPPMSQKDLNEICAKSANSALKDFASLFGDDVFEKTPVPELPTQTELLKKKNASFFDKLKEKLMSGENLICKWCGHESKCLSESAGHQKTCGKQQTSVSILPTSVPTTSSTRCQFCRQRCKSSIDLHNHLQVCNEANKNFEEKPDITIKLEDEHSLERHPMENVTFVWNNISPQPTENLEERIEENSLDLAIQSPESDLMENIGPLKMPTHGNNIDLVAEGRRVFKCPHCSFWATTASRFHVHIVGHLNKKPFECSLCAYRSNWRWDITKHIRLKSVRDPSHEKAKVLMTDETGRRNYSKYNKYLTQLRPNESPENNSPKSQGNVPQEDVKTELPKLTRAPTNSDFASGTNPLRPPPPLKAATDMYFQSFNEQKKRRTSSDSKKTLFKCKKCNFRDASRDNILLHVKGHYRQEHIAPGNAEIDERHCRLKHSGDVRVVIGGKNGSAEKVEIDDQTDEPDHLDVIQNGVFKCKQCPYSSNIESDFNNHLDMHIPKPTSAIKCYFCPFFVSQKFELFDHLHLHGVLNPEDYVNRAMQGRESSPIEGLLKRYKCIMCPYVTNSKSQFLYHKQFHRHRDEPFKCDYCSYNVSKRHLLHQHMKVHGINIPKTENEATEEDFDMDEIEEIEDIPFDVPLVWVSREGKFSKMYKCRYCPHLNIRKINIQEHEKMHIRDPNSPRTGDEHACNDCSYICNNAGVLSSHLKVHQNVYGQIHCLVDTEKTDEEQISELSRLLNVADSNEFTETKEESDDYSDRVLYFCEQCPARFLHEKEYNIHIKFHGIRLFYRCDYCTYASRQRPHQLSHSKVHTDDYQEKTKLYLLEYPVSVDHPPPRTTVIVDAPNNNAPIWVVINEDLPFKSEVNRKNIHKNFACHKCPARFFKRELLEYHLTLHGGEYPHRCRYCDYAAKTTSNLQKHIRIHEESKLEYIPPVKKPLPVDNVPISGTDLFRQKNEAEKNQKDELPVDFDGNPKFIYQKYVRNGRMKDKKYKCFKCPTAFEKREQYKVHLSLHGSEQRYKCDNCDYSVKNYGNYVQHIRKHQINEEALATQEEKTDIPFDKLAIKTLKRGPLKLSVADRQTLMILQQRRNSNASTTKEPPTEEKKLFWCPHCPYTRDRRDAVDNHVNRHICVSGTRSNYTCDHCDYTVPQKQFLREHVKLHFTGQKNHQPEGYMLCNNLQLTAVGDNSDKGVIFQDCGDSKAARFKPALESPAVNNNNNDKIYVNPENGEFLDNSSGKDTKDTKKSL